MSFSKAKPRIPKFEGLVNLTWNANKGFLDFIDANNGKTVGLNVEIDASSSMPNQHVFIDGSPEAFEKIQNCELSGVRVPLPNDTGGIVWLTFNLLNDRRSPPSFGGTGIFDCRLREIDINRTAHSGPAVYFHLMEEFANVEFRSSVFGG